MDKQNENAFNAEDVSDIAMRDSAYTVSRASDYDEIRFVDKSGATIHEVERNCLYRALEKTTNTKKILEVGCGTGRLLVELHNDGFEVDGADASGAMLEQLKLKFANSDMKPELYLCEAAKLDAEANSYDFTYSIRLLNQTESSGYALEVIKDMIRVTKPGKWVLVEFVNEYRPRLGYNKQTTTRVKPKEARKIAEQSGAEFVCWDGAFFVSMQAFYKTPNFLLPALKVIDRAGSFLFPRLCSRCYLMLRKS